MFNNFRDVALLSCFCISLDQDSWEQIMLNWRDELRAAGRIGGFIGE
mgnify:CR=1 FL=1